MSEQQDVYEAVQALLPDTCQILGEQKLQLIIADSLSGSESVEQQSFAAPELGHPAHFIDQIKLAVETIGILIAILKAVNQMDGIMRQHGTGTPPEGGARATRLERIKTTLTLLIRNIK